MYKKQTIAQEKIDEAIEALHCLTISQSIVRTVENEILQLKRGGNFNYWYSDSVKAVSVIISEIINPVPLVYYAQNAMNVEEFHTKLIKSLDIHVKFRNQKYTSLLLQCLLLQHLEKNPGFIKQFNEWFEYEAKREVY